MKGLNASKVLEWVIKKTHDEIRSASNWVMEVILERSKEEVVCGREEARNYWRNKYSLCKSDLS